MTFNPHEEPCSDCGCEPDECVCGLTMDLLSDPDCDLGDLDLDWDHYPDDDEKEGEQQ